MGMSGAGMRGLVAIAFLGGRQASDSLQFLKLYCIAAYSCREFCRKTAVGVNFCGHLLLHLYELPGYQQNLRYTLSAKDIQSFEKASGIAENGQNT